MQELAFLYKQSQYENLLKIPNNAQLCKVKYVSTLLKT